VRNNLTLYLFRLLPNDLFIVRFVGLKPKTVCQLIDKCLASLVYRLLENKLDNYGTHFTTDNILDTLQNINVVN